MKIHLILILALIVVSVSGFAQAPEKLSYQAVIRNAGNGLVSSQAVRMRISILQGSASGSVVYAETQQSSTNASGLVTLEIGSGTVVSGSFAAINWTSGPYFIKTETDPSGGTAYSLTATSQLLSVPFALYSKTSGSSTPGPQGPAGSNGKNALIRTTAEAAGANCANGGVKIEAGVDADGNGTLSDTEVNSSQTKYLCNGAAGATGATGAQGPAGPAGSGGFVHYVGEQFGGGVVFHVYRDAGGTEKVLIVAKVNLGEQGIGVWSNVVDADAGALSTWDGLANSNAIVSQANHTYSAAKLCLDYESDGFADWYLPAIDELTLLFQNLFSVNQKLSQIPNANLIRTLQNTVGYFSSTEDYGMPSSVIHMYDIQGALAGSKSSYGIVRAIRAYSVPSGSGNNVTDVDGNTYETVIIGTQVWMKENLKVSKYRNGDAIPTNLSNTAWQNTTSGAYAVYENNPVNDSIYGKLYNWYAVADSRGLCPVGWHVPSDAEWKTMESFLGLSTSEINNLDDRGSIENVGGKIKATSSLWLIPNTGATNESSYSALPGGARNNNGPFSPSSIYAFFWCNSSESLGYAFNRLFDYSKSSSNRGFWRKEYGFSVRCLKD